MFYWNFFIFWSSFYFLFEFHNTDSNFITLILISNQDCGSGSSSFSESGSGSRPLNQIWRKKSWRVFLSCNKHKRCSKVSNNGAYAILLLKNLIKLQLLAISFIFLFLVDKFTLPRLCFKVQPFFVFNE